MSGETDRGGPRCQACGGPADGWVDVEDPGRGFRRARVCGACGERMDADMWARSTHWEHLNPLTPYDQLEARGD